MQVGDAATVHEAGPEGEVEEGVARIQRDQEHQRAHHVEEQVDTGGAFGVLAGADPRVVGGTLCAVNVANRTMETYSFDCAEELRAGDILRVLRTDQCEGRTIE